MEIRLVPAEKSDAAALDKIQKAAFKRLYEIYHDENSPYIKGVDEILRWLDSEYIRFSKIMYGDTLAGGIAYYRKSEDEWYLARLYVHPDLQRRGIAYTAITLAEAQLEGGTRFTLDFPVDQCANKRTYEKAGYRDTGERRVINELLTLAIYERTPNCE